MKRMLIICFSDEERSERFSKWVKKKIEAFRTHNEEMSILDWHESIDREWRNEDKGKRRMYISDIHLQIENKEIVINHINMSEN